MPFSIPWNTQLLNIVIQNKIKVNQNLLVLLGKSTNNNTLSLTTNLIQWTGNSLFSLTGRALAYDGDITFYAVGEGTNTIIKSANAGQTWNAISSPFSTAGKDIIFAGSQLIACGAGTNLLAYYSETNWIPIFIDATTVNRLYYEPVLSRTYVLSGGNTQMYYTNSISGTWKKIGKYGYIGEFNGMHGPALYNTTNQWIASGTSATTTGLSYSTNGGSTWTSPVNINITAKSISFGVTTTGNPLWVLTGTGTTSTIAHSSNGINWTLLNKSVITIEGNSIVYGSTRDGRSVWVAAGSGTNTLAYSLNGIDWTGLSNSVFSSFGTCVAFGTGSAGRSYWVAGGTGSLNSFANSIDGITWTGSGNSVFTTTYGISYGADNSGNPLFVGAGDGSHSLAYSIDAVNWIGLGKTIFSNYGTCVEYGSDGTGNPVWVAGGSGSSFTLAWSFIGSSGWNGISNNILTLPKNISYGINAAGNPVWIATGDGLSIVAYSMNGINWATITPAVFTSSSLCSFQEKKPKYIVCGTHFDNKPDNIKGSIDGLTWYYIKSPFSIATNDVYWNQAQQLWVAVGEGGNTIAYSNNGLAWTGIGTSVFSARGNKVRYGIQTSKWYAAGEGTNTLAASIDGKSWSPITSIAGYVDISGLGLFAL